MDWICAKHKDFLGKRSLSRSDSHARGPQATRRAAHRAALGRLPEGAQLTDQPEAPTPVPMVGHVSSSYFSACLGHSIALALVKGGRTRMGETLARSAGRRSSAQSDHKRPRLLRCGWRTPGSSSSTCKSPARGRAPAATRRERAGRAAPTAKRARRCGGRTGLLGARQPAR